MKRLSLVMRRCACAAFLCALFAGCGPGYRDDLYRAERRLWKIRKTQSAVFALPKQSQNAGMKETAQAYAAFVAGLPDPGALDPTSDPLLSQLLQIRATAQMEEARWLAASGNEEGALEALRQASRDYAWNPRVTAEAFLDRLALLEKRVDADAYAEAVEELVRTVDLAAFRDELPPRLVSSLRTSARLYAVQQRVDRAAIQRKGAVQILTGLLEKGPAPVAEVLIETELALLAIEGGDPKASLGHYEKAIDASRGTEWQAALEFSVANLYLGALDRPSEAVDRFRRFAEDHPESPLAARALLLAGTALRTLSRHEEALLVLSRADSLAQRNPDLHAAIILESALVENGRGQWPRALSLLRRAVADAPRTPAGLSAPLYIASHHLAQGEEAAARAVIDRTLRDYDGIAETETDPEVLLTVLEMRSKARILLEDWEEAVEALLEIARFAPGSDIGPPAILEAARLSTEKLERPELTRRIWNQVIAVYPNTPLADLAARELGAHPEP